MNALKINHLATWRGVAAICFWSSSTALMRSITEALGALFGAACIYSLSAVMIAIAQRGRFPRHLSKRYMLGGGVLFVLYEILLSQAIGLAQNNLQSIEVGLINYAWPCLTILLAVCVGLQKSSLALWCGALISFAGIGWGVTGAHWSLSGMVLHIQSNPVSYLFALMAAFLWAVYCSVTRLYGRGQNGVLLFFIAISVVLWGKYCFSPVDAVHWSWAVGAQLVVMSLFTALGYVFWDTGIQKGNMTLLAILSYFIPLLSTLISSWWLDTPLSVAFWQSVALVTAGSLICWYGCQQASHHTVQPARTD
jgi:drug/metabolite transporter (DMT)-like permease